MKMISPLLTVAITALSFVVVAPGADARPPGKSHGLPSLKDRTEKSQRVSTTAMPKTIGLMAAGDTKLRFKRKIGGPVQVLKVKQVARQGAPAAGGHIHPKIGGRQSHGSH